MPDANSPCDANGLPHLQRGLQSFPIHWRDLVNAQPGAYKNECRMEFAIVIDSNLLQLVHVDIGAVA